jgi:hypothetical protein
MFGATKIMYRIIVVVFVLNLGLGLTTFGQAPPQSAPAVEPAEEPLSVLSVPRDYRYNSKGRRDPFVNPVPKAASDGPAAPSVRPPGLKGVLVTEAGIAGVVTSKEPSMNIVIITAPARKSYFARVGDALFDGVVKEIRLDTVTFALNLPAGNREGVPREIVRKVRPTPGDNK